jgi:tetratricopeptide (TPR) repeat protein
MALESAGKPTSTRVDAELARELAYRSAVRTVLEGRIGRLGKGYSIVLRLLDADTVRTLVSVSDAAADEGALIPAVSRISRKLRAELGERRSAIQGTTELFWITTPSFEAYKLFRRGVQLHWDGDQRGAITLMRRAIALDPDFAAAWGTMGFCFGNLNEVDSSLAAFDQALVRPQRLDEQFKLLNAAMVASTKNDLTGALVALEELLRLNPENRFAHNNRGAVLSSLGRLDEALESIRTAKRLSPFGPTAGNLHNEFWYLLQLHRLDEARQLAPKLSGSLAASAPMWIAAASGEWPTAEGAATALENSLDADLRFQSEGILAAARASRGELKSAEQVLRRPRSDAGIVGESLIVNRTRWRRLLLALCSHGVTTVPGGAGRWDSTTAGLVTRGAWAAAEGDTALAQRLLAAVRTRSAPQVSSVGFMPAVVEAWIAARAGRWEDVVRDLGPLALQGDATGFVGLQSAPLAPWLVAEAYEHLDRPDSAAAYFERVFTPPPTGDAMYYLPQIGMASSFAHRRLVLLYARMGRLEDARRHWEIFSAAFTHPDPEMRPLVEEARAALESAEGMARTARQ